MARFARRFRFSATSFGLFTGGLLGDSGTASGLPSGNAGPFGEPAMWHRWAILGVLGLILGQSIVIALLVLERRRRHRARLALEDQAAFGQAIEELTTDVVRQASDDAPGGLADALARVGRYAGARTAALIPFGDGSVAPPIPVRWRGDSDRATDIGSDTATSILPRNRDMRLDIPLVVDGATIGALELYRADDGRGWPPQLVHRLEGAGEILAGAVARKGALHAVQRGEAFNHAVLASLPARVAILDSRGNITRTNEAWSAVAQRAGVAADRRAFVGENYLDECTRAAARGCEKAQEVRRGIEAVLAGERWSFRHEYHWSTPVETWYELTVVRLASADCRAIVSHLDITERRLAERRAEDTTRQVAHLNRVAMIGQLGAGISHELCQPLTAIRLNADAAALMLANESADASAEARHVLADIVDDAERASSIVDNIRALIRKQPSTRAAVDLNDVCRRAAALLQRDALLRQAHVVLQLEPDAPPVVCDPVEIQQVVLNLAINALDATAAATADRAVVVGTAQRDGEVEIFVRDTGPGLPPDVEGHLFESFYSTKAHGLGLGLVIVRSIVERHRGRVSAENCADRGAVFRVQLPVS